jgi:hypothetical protein
MRQILLWLACGLVLSCTPERKPSPRASSPPKAEIEVHQRPTSLGTEFSVEKEGCRIEWTVLASEAGVIRHRSDCALTLADQAPLIGNILHGMQNSTTVLIRTLYWGRLFPDGAKDTTMPERLAAAAKVSADWDSARGKPGSRDVNGWVRTLANDAMIYGELRAVFRRAGFEIELSSVEKVLVLPAGELPFFDRLRDLGAGATDKVPFDFQAWFSVRPLSGNSPDSR